MHLQTQYLCFTNIHIFLFLIEMVVSTYTFASCFFPLTIWESGICNHKQNCLVLFVGCIVFHMCIGCAIIFKPVLYGRIFKVFTRFCSYKGHYTNDCVCIVLYLQHKLLEAELRGQRLCNGDSYCQIALGIVAIQTFTSIIGRFLFPHIITNMECYQAFGSLPIPQQKDGISLQFPCPFLLL